MYVKQRMVYMDNKAVNPLTKVFLLCLALFLGSCGFQLNRNQLSLPNQAQNIKLERVKNQSYRPAADLALTLKLREALASAGIPVKNRGDLTFSVIITSYSTNRSELEIGSNKTYVYLFTYSANLSLKDNRDQSVIFTNESVSGQYRIETTDDVLTETQKDQGADKAMAIFTKNILLKITQNF